MDIIKFAKKPVMGILRGVELELIAPLIETSVSAGLETIEITMNTKNAVEVIKTARAVAGKRLAIGAGTVVDMNLLKSAIDSGATFIVTPVLIRDVAEYCVRNKIPVFPGGLTPQEIYAAWNAGATMVKVFPSGFFGPEYFKEIKGPFGEVKLLACGGVTPENIGTYFANGADAVAFGASVFRKEWLDKKDFASIGNRIKQFLSKIPS